MLLKNGLICGVLLGFLVLNVPGSSDGACDSDWLNYGGQCYYISNGDNAPADQLTTWRRAREWCMSKGGDLATIKSIEERRWLTTRTENRTYKGAMWIGLNSLPDGKKFGWVDQDTSTFTNWIDGEPRNDASGMCVAQLSNRPANCYEKHDGINLVADLFPNGIIPVNSSGVRLGYLYGLSDADGREQCHKRCDDFIRPCTAYTFISNSNPDNVWRGECLARLDGARVESPNTFAFSGLKISCGDDDGSGMWYIANCGESAGFICKKSFDDDTTAKTVAPTIPTPGYCPSGYFEASPAGGDKCFRIVHVTVQESNDLSWNDALNVCRGGPGLAPDLASIQSFYETAVIAMNIPDYAWGYWIGLRTAERSDNVWTWSDNSDFGYTNWASGRPDVTTKRCGEILTYPEPLGTWGNQDCTYRRAYICQTHKDPNSTILTPPPTESSTLCTIPGFHYHNRACYRVMTTSRTWSAARDECRAVGADLVSVHHESENAALIVFSYAVGGQVWLGMSKFYSVTEQDSEWYWSDGWPIVYTNWDPQSPAEPPSPACGYLDSNGRWKKNNCSVAMPAICKKSLDPLPPTPSPGNGTGSCPTADGWEEFNGFCYYVSKSTDTTASTNRQTAASLCQVKAGYYHTATLASIHHSSENKFIYEKLKANGKRQAWIGLKKDGLNSQWKWDDGSSVQYLTWAPGEPNDRDGTQPCVEMYVDLWPGLWNDHYCSDSTYNRGFVCKAEKAIVPSIPTAPPNLACPSSECTKWRSFGSYCYYFENTKQVNWNDAQTDCKKIGGRYANLVTVADGITNIYLLDELKNLSMTYSRLWIGYYRKNHDTAFAWIDGTPKNMEFWAPGEPNNQGNEHCAELVSNTGEWNDMNCETNRLYYICQVTKQDLGITIYPPTVLPDQRQSDGEIVITSAGMAGVVLGTALAVALLLAIGYLIMSRFKKT